MKYLVLLLTLLIPPVVSAQANVVRAVIYNEEVVEFVPHERGEDADFVQIDIRYKGKVVKKFSVDNPSTPQIIGTFQGVFADYVLYRTDMGSGGCAGGSLYVVEFANEFVDRSIQLKYVRVSPALTTCLGEFPVFSVLYKGNSLNLLIAGHSIDIGFLNKWVPVRTAVTKTKKKK